MMLFWKRYLSFFVMAVTPKLMGSGKRWQAFCKKNISWRSILKRLEKHGITLYLATGRTEMP
jgi:hypothetical protein